MTVNLVEKLDKRASVAVIDSGMFLFLKIPDSAGTSQILGKRLTPIDRSILSEHPTLLKSPIEILDRLEDLRRIEKKRIEYLCQIASELPKEEPKL